jgi:hypothetical protein
MSRADQLVDQADQLVDQAADRLQEFANQAAAEGGFKAKLAEPLADDAAFLRRLKPSLIKARFKGDAPTDLAPAHGTVSPALQMGERPKPPGEDGPNPFVVIGVALVAGIVLAKIIDWRGHAHPRD